MLSHYPLQALRGLMRDEQPQRGVVMRIENGMVMVATARGMQRFIAHGDVQVGQTVALQSNVAYAALTASADRIYQL